MTRSERFALLAIRAGAAMTRDTKRARIFILSRPDKREVRTTLDVLTRLQEQGLLTRGSNLLKLGLTTAGYAALDGLPVEVGGRRGHAGRQVHRQRRKRVDGCTEGDDARQVLRPTVGGRLVGKHAPL